MKGVILAGGRGTRLHPLTKVTNKHLLPVGHEPMIYNPIKQLVSCDITEILIITSTQHMGDVVNLLGSGKEFGCEFTYKVQEEAGGIAQALSLAENFASNEKIVVILGDNISDKSIKKSVDSFRHQEIGARVLLKKVGDPERYGVAAIDERNVIQIEEKPQEPKSDFAVIGYYMFDNQVFDFIREIAPSGRGELEITSVNNLYISAGQLKYDIHEGNWTDAGTIVSYQYANQFLIKVKNEIQG
ncbi:sugar phosphate nucleotidyltransferase [Alkalihalobacillus sp. AL-G]|uniref:sugar phosphate nucleotidyltransferase n=1 Tax=Alkalihalobacillus sp. AL-G TaxID=2926399 RepID=UPI00272A607E|nr:sugar phosphate nucleotidyltransferase [Alkalihalobacillus sp. AL-G]WLD93018.1 sugar phosphate nucleotidyltransferase [Alkalihalobacillus sp. AL-G]